jgi:drug/metabolite transporter (DMT)-like permease
MNTRIVLLLSVLFASCGQLLFKKGMSFFKSLKADNGIASLLPDIVRAVFSPLVFSGLVLYVLSTVLWLLALSKADLSYAYPFTLLTFLLVMAGSYFIFHEGLQPNRVAGAVIIAAGVLVVSIR